MARGTKGHLYEAEDGFRWHLKSGNNKVIAESGEAYDEERKAQAAFDKAFQGLHPLVLVDGEELPAQTEVEEATQGDFAGARGGSGGFDSLPQDPSHPLYSPYTVDGNKVSA